MRERNRTPHCVRALHSTRAPLGHWCHSEAHSSASTNTNTSTTTSYTVTCSSTDSGGRWGPQTTVKYNPAKQACSLWAKVTGQPKRKHLYLSIYPSVCLSIYISQQIGGPWIWGKGKDLDRYMSCSTYTTWSSPVLRDSGTANCFYGTLHLRTGLSLCLENAWIGLLESHSLPINCTIWASSLFLSQSFLFNCIRNKTSQQQIFQIHSQFALGNFKKSI